MLEIEDYYKSFVISLIIGDMTQLIIDTIYIKIPDIIDKIIKKFLDKKD